MKERFGRGGAFGFGAGGDIAIGVGDDGAVDARLDLTGRVGSVVM